MSVVSIEQKSDGGHALQRRHRFVAVICAFAAVGMVGMSYAAVPLYQIFCQVTGYAGTTQVAATPSDVVLARSIDMRFDANVSSGLPWAFEPVQRVMRVQIGENGLAHYRATNTSDKPVKGTATFNVSPAIVGVYFNKLECFCFTEQVLQPGESVEMPVSFFVDPSIMDDEEARRLSQITLSYTFFPVKDQANNAGSGHAGKVLSGG